MSFFLSHAVPLFIAPSWGMDPVKSEESNIPLSKKPIFRIQPAAEENSPFVLMDGITAFEEKKYVLAAKILGYLHSKGAMIPSEYCLYMKENKLADIHMPQEFYLETIPKEGIKLSKDFLRTSLTWMKYQSAKTKANVKELVKLIYMSDFYGANHAITLCRKAYQDDPKFLKLLPPMNGLKQIKKADDFYDQVCHVKICTEPLVSWTLLDPNQILAMTSSILPAPQKEAFSVFQKAYRANPRNLGSIALQISKMYPSQIYWAHLAVENGASLACLKLGTHFYFRDYPKETSLQVQEKNRSFERYYASHLLKSKKSEYSPSLGMFLCNRAISFYNGEEGKEKQINKAKVYFKKALENGFVGAECAYGRMYQEENNLMKAYKYLKRAADKGDEEAQYGLAELFYLGTGVEQNFLEARKYAKLASEKKLPDAEAKYGEMLWYGEGGDPDPEEACRYFKRAMDQGIDASTVFYGIALAMGRGIKKDIQEARKYFKLIADKGDSDAQLNYAQTFLDTEGDTLEEINEACKSCMKAMETKANLDSHILLYSLNKKREALELILPKNEEKLETQDDAIQKPDQDLKNSESVPQIVFTEDGENHLDSDNQIEITLPLLEDISEETDEELLALMPTIVPSESILVLEEKILEINPLIEDQIPLLDQDEINRNKLLQEINYYDNLCLKEIQSLSAKKRDQKAAAARNKLTLTLNKKDFEQTCKTFEMGRNSIMKPKKRIVEFETMELVKTLFGQGKTKINNFSNTSARQAFADLGCRVEQKKKENSTLVYYNLENGRTIKLKYHNPHESGDDHLYEALRHHLKSFLSTINMTPETVQVR